MNKDDAGHLAQIESTFADLDQWRENVAAPQPEPLVDSDLAVDDRDWPWFPVSEAARSGLCAAADHLSAYRTLIAAQSLHPWAALTLVRAAIVGGAQAVWVLSPDDSELRCQRARCAALEWYQRQLQHARGLVMLPGADQTTGRTVIEATEERVAQLRALREAHAQRMTYEATAMIHAATLATFADRRDRARFADEAVVEWRRTSGSAHGLSWAMLGGRGAEPITADDKGMAWLAVAGELDSSINPYLLAYHLSRHGWALLHRRSGRDATGVDRG